MRYFYRPPSRAVALALRCSAARWTSTGHPPPGSSALLPFAQGTTELHWKPSVAHPDTCYPSVRRAETWCKRGRLFGMPKGYPDTTADGFQRYFYLQLTSSFISNFASSIGYQSLLNGFFLGSSPQLWMLKDLVPALLAAYLANAVVSYENRPKFWFVVSVMMNNFSVISDMLIPSAVPDHLLVAAIVTSVVKQSSALMYFVTRASALQHFAINNNLAELTKKFNSFGMVSYTVATALGIVYCTYIASFTVQLITVLCCCAANMVLAPMSMNDIAFRILNFTTMKLVMREYLHSGTTPTPDAISRMLGVRMVGPEEDASIKARHELLYISPPVDKLLIRSHTLHEDVLYVSSNRSFLIGLWVPTPIPLTWRESWARYELPTFLRGLHRGLSVFHRQRVQATDQLFGGQRLVLLVQNGCTAQDLFEAHLLLHTAITQHTETEEDLRRFLRGANLAQEEWRTQTSTLMTKLEAAGWDVELPALDHPNLRLSELFIGTATTQTEAATLATNANR